MDLVELALGEGWSLSLEWSCPQVPALVGGAGETTMAPSPGARPGLLHTISSDPSAHPGQALCRAGSDAMDPPS